MKEIINRIDELRKKKGLSKRGLMLKMGIPSSTFNSWYYAGITPTLANIENICAALDITVEQFFNGLRKKTGESAEEKFLSEWRMLTDLEKSAVESVITAFKDDKAVKND